MNTPPPPTPPRFFIVNGTDRPSEEHLAERRQDGKFYYAHPELRDVKRYWGMTPPNPTPIEEFGMRVALMDDNLYCTTDRSLEVSAKYNDGRPRKWQGEPSFEFPFKNTVE